MADVAKLVAKADEAAQKRNYDYAIELYLQAVTLEPDNAQARKALRQVEVKRATEMGGTPKVVAAILGLPSRVAAGIFGLGKNFEKQALAYEAILRRDPQNTGAALALAGALYRAGSKKSARAVFEAIPEWDAGCLRALVGAGKLAREAGDLPAALALFQRAKGVSPNDKEVIDAIRDISATQSIGVREGAGSYREVLKDASQAADLERRQRLQGAEGETTSSAEALEAQLKKQPGDLATLRRLARLYEQAKASDKAVETYQRILRIEPNDFDAESRISDLKVADLDRRVGKLEQMAKATPGDAKIKTELEETRARRIAFEVEDLQKRVAAHPTETQLRFRWGVALHRAGKWNEAVAEFQQTKREPMLARESAFWLGRCFLDLGKAPLAAKQLEAAIVEREGQRLDEIGKEAHYYLGQALRSQGDTAGARRHFERIYEEDINFRDVARLVEAG